MRLKTSLPVLFFIVFSLSAQAQIFRLGVVGGINSSKVTFSSIERNSVDILITDPNMGFHAGLWSRFKVANLFVQPEAHFNRLSGQLMVSQSAAPTDDYAYTIQRLDIPVNVGFKVGPLGVFAGPVFSYHLESVSDALTAYKTDGTVGYTVGVSLMVGKVMLQSRFENTITPYAQSVNIDINGQTRRFEANSRIPQLVVSLGYSFF